MSSMDDLMRLARTRRHASPAPPPPPPPATAEERLAAARQRIAVAETAVEGWEQEAERQATADVAAAETARIAALPPHVPFDGGAREGAAPARSADDQIREAMTKHIGDRSVDLNELRL